MTELYTLTIKLWKGEIYDEISETYSTIQEAEHYVDTVEVENEEELSSHISEKAEEYGIRKQMITAVKIK